MHPDQVLLEVVEPRPQLRRLSAAWCEALVHPRFADVLSMDRFLVPIEVVDGCEANLTPGTTVLDATVLP